MLISLSLNHLKELMINIIFVLFFFLNISTYKKINFIIDIFFFYSNKLSKK